MGRKNTENKHLEIFKQIIHLRDRGFFGSRSLQVGSQNDGKTGFPKIVKLNRAPENR